MPDVVVNGRVVPLGGTLAMGPWIVDHSGASDDRHVVLTGRDLPAAGSSASARGSLAGGTLTVAEWWAEPDVHPAWQPGSEAAGVDAETARRALDTLPAADRDVVSVGRSKIPGGRSVAEVQLIRITPAVAQWLVEQQPGSVAVHPFIRDAELPAVLDGGYDAR